MALKTSLDALTMEATVLGGALLGKGGGGKLEDGLYLGGLATAQRGATLIEPASLPDGTVAAAVMPLYMSGHDTHQIHPRQAHRAVTLLQDNLEGTIDGLVNGGLGAVDSIIGWEISAFLGVPLLDSGIPAAYQPASLPNLLAFRQETAAGESFTVSLAGRFGKGNSHRKHLWHGRPAELQRQLADLPAAEKESYVAAAGPLRAGDGEPGQVSHTLQTGQAMLAVLDDGGEATVEALKRLLPLHVSTLATVTGMSWHGQGQEAYGLIEMRDVQNKKLQLTYGQRYRELSIDGRQTAVFPDLIITLGILGTPLTGEEVFMGQDLYLMTVPQASTV